MENTFNQRIRKFIKYKKISIRKFEEACGFSNGYVNNLSLFPSADKLEKILQIYPELNRIWLLTGESEMLNEKVGEVGEPAVNYKRKGSPYYDVDFIGEFNLVENDQTINPEYYIDLPQYNESGVLWCNIYGNSMYPFICSGDKIAIKEVPVDSIIFGKVYGVITNSGLRTVKWVVRSPEMGCYRLVPENKDMKFGDYQDMKIESIIKMFVVLGAIRSL